MGIYVLLMILSAPRPDGGVAVVQQEFNSWELCEAARKGIIKSKSGDVVISAHGCFKK